MYAAKQMDTKPQTSLVWLTSQAARAFLMANGLDKVAVVERCIIFDENNPKFAYQIVSGGWPLHTDMQFHKC